MPFTSPESAGALSPRRKSSFAATVVVLVLQCALVAALSAACGPEADRGGLMAQSPDGHLFFSARLTGAQTIDELQPPALSLPGARAAAMPVDCRRNNGLPGWAARRFSPELSRFALFALAASSPPLHIASTS